MKSGSSGRPSKRRPGVGARGGVKKKGAKSYTAQNRGSERSMPPPSTTSFDGIDGYDPEGERLQKVLAAAGVASRRACEQLISEGRVSVNGRPIVEQGFRIDPSRAVVHVDGSRVQLDTTKVYLVLNKPRGMVCTMADPHGRPCLSDLVGKRHDRLFHVGRLDADTEGLLLLTNDGDLAHRLMHPSFEIRKTYLANVQGAVAKGVGRQLRAGVRLDDGPVDVDSFKVIDSQPGSTLCEIILHEGRNHIVRRLMAHMGNPVQRLVRTTIGSIRLGDLKPGSYRPLNSQELTELMNQAGM